MGTLCSSRNLETLPTTQPDLPGPCLGHGHSPRTPHPAAGAGEPPAPSKTHIPSTAEAPVLNSRLQCHCFCRTEVAGKQDCSKYHPSPCPVSLTVPFQSFLLTLTGPKSIQHTDIFTVPKHWHLSPAFLFLILKIHQLKVSNSSLKSYNLPLQSLT